MPKDYVFTVPDDKTPVSVQGEITTQDFPEGNLTIKFPNINQKYFIDIHPID